jgi:hypothetical protein
MWPHIIDAWAISLARHASTKVPQPSCVARLNCPVAYTSLMMVNGSVEPLGGGVVGGGATGSAGSV